MIILACGGCGFAMVSEQRRQERLLVRLQQALFCMEWELQFRLTPLPELCRQAGKEAAGELGSLLRELADQLDGGTAPEVADCMKAVLRNHRDLPPQLRRLLHQLGRSLGRFDLPGQLEGLKALQKACQREYRSLSENRQERMRSCRTLGLCAGAALVILFA